MQDVHPFSGQNFAVAIYPIRRLAHDAGIERSGRHLEHPRLRPRLVCVAHGPTVPGQSRSAVA